MMLETKATRIRCVRVVNEASIPAQEGNMVSCFRIEAPRPGDSIGGALRSAYLPDQRLPREMAALLAKLDDGRPEAGF
jgi:hypothetical protein